MKSLRLLSSAAVLVLGGFLIYQDCVMPYRCNQKVKYVRKAVLQAMNRGNQHEAATLAETELPELERCSRFSETNVEVYVTRGALLRLVNRWEEAIHAYEESLRYDRRPEIYWNIADCYFALGRRERAIEYFAISSYVSSRQARQIPEHLADDVDRRRREMETNQPPF